MPNLSYNRSRRREQEFVRKYRGMGWYAARSAGSKSPWDVWAVDPNTGFVRLIQIKTTRGARKIKPKLLKQYGPNNHIQEWLIKYV